MLSSQPGLLAGLLFFSIAVVLSTSWTVARLRGGAPGPVTAASLLAELLWALILFLAGVVAARYIERSSAALPFWLLFGVLVTALSLLRALLYHRQREEGAKAGGVTVTSRARANLWQLAYLLFAFTLYLGLAWLAGWYVDPVLFLALAAGALLPSLDTPRSWLGRLLSFASTRVEARYGHQGAWHSLGALGLVALGGLPFVLIVDWAPWAALLLGFTSHLGLDLLKPGGIPLFWPLTGRRFALFGGPMARAGQRAEGWLTLGLLAAVLILLASVDIGQPPPPPPPDLSYDQTLEKYYSLRGRSQVVAAVEGTWQATGRRIRDRFEVLNAAGRSFIMLDRFTGRVFSAGRGADDNLYLNRINLQAGEPVTIQAVEVHLESQPLSAALPVVYQMEREPGLQHIFISGDLVLAPIPEGGEASLQASHAQTSLRRVIPASDEPGDGHWRIEYLTAAELIALAQAEVESADLVIVATYVEADTGPTPTPLPALPAVGDEP